MPTTMSVDDYYRVLELSRGASAEQIKESYRRLVRRWHPDKFAHEPEQYRLACERLKQLNEAYDLLRSNPTGTAEELCEEIEKTIDHFLSRYPLTDGDTIAKALQMVVRAEDKLALEAALEEGRQHRPVADPVEEEEWEEEAEAPEASSWTSNTTVFVVIFALLLSGILAAWTLIMVLT